MARDLAVDELHALKRRRKREDRLDTQTRRAKALHRLAGIPLGPCGLKELDAFQAVMKDVQIVVFGAENQFRVIFKGPPLPNHIFLLLSDAHFDVILSPQAFFGSKGFCHQCLSPFNNEHTCPGFCMKCNTLGFHPPTPITLCADCNRYFRGDACFRLHKQTGICERLHRCPTCTKTVKTSLPHVCSAACQVCQSEHEPGYCYVKKLDPPTTPRFLRVYYDFETYVKDKEHVPILVCAAFEQEDGTYESLTFWGENCTAQFLDHLLSTVDGVVPRGGKRRYRQRQPRYTKRIVLAHNASSFDAIFLLKYFYANHLTPELIFNGAKCYLIYLKGPQIKFLDSCLFLRIPLRRFADTFGLEETKGWFPYKFVSDATLTYAGEIPDLTFFEPERLDATERDALIAWHRQHGEFNVRTEMIKYCQQDVRVLQAGFDQFCTLFESITHLTPAQSDVTLAGFCNRVFQTNYLQPNTIGIVPAHGFRSITRQSEFALKVIQFYEKEWGMAFQTATSPKGEFKVPPYSLDAYSAEHKCIIEVNGDYFHGNLNRYQPHTINAVCKRSMQDLFERSHDRIAYIQKALPDHTVHVIWESDFKAFLKSNAEANALFSSLVVPQFIQPREALFGGRCEVFQLYAQGGAKDPIRILDVVSMYPKINLSGEFPRGFPKVLTSDLTYTPGSHFGLVKALILPPKNLYLPVLPFKEDKLYFCLCKTCAINKVPPPCRHNDLERAFIGCYTTPELDLALERGYRLLHIHEIWSYEQTCVGGTPTGLFDGYMTDLIRVKVEASGPPNLDMSPSDLDAYVAEFLETEGIALNKENLIRNEGLRKIGKESINSLWGRNALNLKRSKTVLVNTYCALMALFQDESKVVTNLVSVSEEFMLATYEESTEFQDSYLKGSIVLAIFTTSLGRCQLYRHLEAVGKHALYTDTDSLIYHAQEGVPRLPEANRLGCLTSDVGDTYLTEFAATGPKSYAYRTAKGTTCVKVKGISMTPGNKNKINLQSLKNLVLAQDKTQSILADIPFPIKRSKAEGRLFIGPTEKNFKYTFDKRYVDPLTLTTQPWGLAA